MKTKSYIWLIVIPTIIAIDWVVYNSSDLHVGSYRLYCDIWLLFYLIKTFAIFFFLAGLIKYGQRNSTKLVTAFLIVYLLTQAYPVAIVGAIAGISIGYFWKKPKASYLLAVKVGIIALIADILWPSNLMTYPALAVNRPSLLNFIVGLFSDASFKLGMSRSTFMNGDMIEKQVGYLFGIYPITVGHPEGLMMLRPELQVVFCIVVFLLIYWLTKAFMSNYNHGKKVEDSIIFAIAFYGFVFLPVIGIINILLVILGVFLGIRAYQSNFVFEYFHNLHKKETLVITTVCIALYQLCFRVAIESGFSMVGSIDQQFLYSGAAILSLILGMVIGRTNELSYFKTI
jgi:hypothetical protein